MPTIKKAVLLLQFLLGLSVLVGLVVFQPVRPVGATEPTATPPVPAPAESAGGTAEGLCRLEVGAACEFPGRGELTAADVVRPAVNPAIGAREVPTYTLVSVTFGPEMDLNTINNDTFYVSQNGVRLAGTVRYLDASRMAVFYPDSPLLPDGTYTATVTTEVKDLTGQALAEALSWRFTTVAEDSPFAAAGNGILGSGMKIYFGDLHSHSGYSDGQSTPATAYATARANGLDFFALTDHDIMLTQTEWEDTLVQAKAATVDGAFIALRGFEFTHPEGHLNIFETDTFVRGDDPTYANLASFYGWLLDRPNALLAQFNHSVVDGSDLNFYDFAFYPAVDQKIILRELSTVSQFFLSLNAGWHLGSLANSDTHHATWGCCPAMGLVAPALTKPAILDALKARRTFFVSPGDRNLALVMQANGYWMGSAIPNTATLNFVVTAYDPDLQSKPLRMALYDNGVRVASISLPPSTVYRWTPTVSGRLGHYYYAEAYYDGWYYPAYSSPIWVERPPVAEAGPAQVVPPGAVVTLNGTGSWDPDGDAVAYRWTQEGGSGVTLNAGDTGRPTFVAPNIFGDLTFRLTVVDTGSLSSADSTVVTVTDKPFLTIQKSGPATAKPGELITYDLTVTNIGVNEALNVIVTDVVPTGAIYQGGGTLSGNTVSWPVFNLPAGGTKHLSFTVTTDRGIANSNYGATCGGCVPAVGQEIIFTNAKTYYFPLIGKGF